MVIDRILADVRINKSFKNSNIEKIKASMKEYISDACGGSKKYTGRDLREIHISLNIKDTDIDVF